ncbi:MAG: hypothetical protein KAI83_09260 [Thiomargarita sp.]|nr:hypothetical protein [Thiomargarita sp.]
MPLHQKIFVRINKNIVVVVGAILYGCPYVGAILYGCPESLQIDLNKKKQF